MFESEFGYFYWTASSENARSTHQLNDNSRHVVAAQALRSRQVLSAAVVTQAFNAGNHVLYRNFLCLEAALVDVLVAEVDTLLRSLHVPDAIAGEENKLDVSFQLSRRDVRERSDLVVLGLQQLALLVLEVTESAG